MDHRSSIIEGKRVASHVLEQVVRISIFDEPLGKWEECNDQRPYAGRSRHYGWRN